MRVPAKSNSSWSSSTEVSVLTYTRNWRWTEPRITIRITTSWAVTSGRTTQQIGGTCSRSWPGGTSRNWRKETRRWALTAGSNRRTVLWSGLQKRLTRRGHSHRSRPRASQHWMKKCKTKSFWNTNTWLASCSKNSIRSKSCSIKRGSSQPLRISQQIFKLPLRRKRLRRPTSR